MSNSGTEPNWIDPDDAPELTEAWFAKAALMESEQPVDRDGITKEQVTLRIDQDVIGHFRAAGPGWQARINAALRKLAGL